MAKSDITTLWLYLAKRDAKGIRILANLQGREHSAVRLTDLTVLQLPSKWHLEIDQMIQDNRLLWEPWIESAATYEELRQRLKKRGYSGIPVNGQPDFMRSELLPPLSINVTILPEKKTMVRKIDS